MNQNPDTLGVFIMLDGVGCDPPRFWDISEDSSIHSER